ncbi:hypothetical protein EBR96_09800, partial [bacterium]|nr:hypothetical protein [bacterium]
MRALLLKFFEKVGKSQEIELYLNKFRLIPRSRFAIIRIAYNVLENQLSEIAENIAFMQQMGIYPVLLLDLKTTEYSEFSVAPISDTMAGRRFAPIANRFAEAIKSYGGSAEIVDNAVDVTSTRVSKWEIHRHVIESALSRDSLPIIMPFGRRSRRRVFVNADELGRLLIEELNPVKFIFITENGGISDKNDQVLPFLNLSQRKEWIHVKDEMKPILKEVRILLKKSPDCAVIFTAPENLLKEIFTVKGSGTFVKKYSIIATSKIKELDQERMRTLLEDAFGKILVDDFFEEKIKMIFVEKDYEGVAIIKKVRGIPYLDKIAVATTEEGTGLGRSLWQKVAEMYPKLIWRSLPTNPLSSF